MEQLIFIAIFLLAALADLFVRWMRGKTKAPDARDEPVVFEAPDILDEPDVFEEPLVLEEPVPAELPPAPVRAPALEEILVRRPARESAAPPPPPRPPAPHPPPAPRTRRRARARGWIASPASAREGIVLMTILGPCRGLE